jgi:hypothetical protein
VDFICLPPFDTMLNIAINGFRNSSGSLAIFAAIRRAKQPELLDGDVSDLDTCSDFLSVMLR